ncbi:MAG: 50S ribosomal protein L23 [Minisyncoccia bacterium]
MTEKKTKKTTVAKATKVAKVTSKEVSKEVKTSGEHLLTSALILKRPRLTEKSGLQAENSQIYTFEITPRATKTMVKQAVAQMYKVTPIKVNITKLPAKNVFVRGRKGVKSGVKKAVVYLKKGDKIEFI